MVFDKVSINLDKIRLYCILHHITDGNKVPWCGNCGRKCRAVKSVRFFCDYEGNEKGNNILLPNTFTLKQPMKTYDVYCGFYNFEGCDDCIPER